jgi:uncharacterized membrane protein YphA (DoxX/SURF4 family)
MPFSHYAAIAIVPTLSRIVLCLAFLIAGYTKVFTTAEYDADKTRRLQELGVAVQMQPEGASTAAAMYNVALTVDRAGWPYPAHQAKAAAYTELIAGALLVVGLFSRLAALGLAGVMVAAFALTTFPVLQSTSLLQLPIPDYTRLIVQLALFVLAFGIVLTGPGPLSLDRFIFTSAAPPKKA